MASHFVSALNISRPKDSRKRIHAAINDPDFEDCEDDGINLDVETNMEVEASGDDEEVLREASITDFDAGDVVGKLMAFIAQLCSRSEGTQNYLTEFTVSNGCVPWHIKLWVRTHWGSLSDCF